MWCEKATMLVKETLMYMTKGSINASTNNIDPLRYMALSTEAAIGPNFVPLVNLLDINPFPNKPWFLRVCSTILLKTLHEKEILLVTSNFFFSHSVFYHSGELSAIFIQFEIVVCKLFQFGRV